VKNLPHLKTYLLNNQQLTVLCARILTYPREAFSLWYFGGFQKFPEWIEETGGISRRPPGLV